jgi:transposase, IS30 family
MAEHARFSVATGVPVYFCDPHSPWQRGSNENTNGLLRQYFPRSTDFRAVTQSDLDTVAAELNDRPRQTLGWKSPCQTLDQALRPPEAKGCSARAASAGICRRCRFNYWMSSVTV